MWRLTERMVRSTLVTACRLATSPTSTSPDLAKATTEGVVRAPSALAMTVGSPPSRTATTLFVVPRSMPTARAMLGYLRGCGTGCLRVICGAILATAPATAKILESIRLRSVHGLQRTHGAGCSAGGKELLRCPGRWSGRVAGYSRAVPGL